MTRRGHDSPRGASRLLSSCKASFGRLWESTTSLLISRTEIGGCANRSAKECSSTPSSTQGAGPILRRSRLVTPPAIHALHENENTSLASSRLPHYDQQPLHRESSSWCSCRLLQQLSFQRQLTRAIARSALAVPAKKVADFLNTCSGFLRGGHEHGKTHLMRVILCN